MYLLADSTSAHMGGGRIGKNGAADAATLAANAAAATGGAPWAIGLPLLLCLHALRSHLHLPCAHAFAHAAPLPGDCQATRARLR
jgi:hypothetical protein